VSEHANRARLTPAQAQGLRYFALTLAYVASTADMFITGLGQSVILPLALAGLSVLGVLAGIFFRVRAYLFLGVAFLAVVLVSQIWHAAIDQNQLWVLWASGVALGVAVLALFAVFEKRRQDVQAVLANLAEWE
jgi:predicted membrane channel-forming protein YqfA (hemolysin III family)